MTLSNVRFFSHTNYSYILTVAMSHDHYFTTKATKPTQIGKDEVTFRRNTVKLIEEFQKKNSKNSLVAELLLITHKTGEFIHYCCQERTTDLIEEFPFLASKNVYACCIPLPNGWVFLTFVITLLLLCN